MTPSNLISLQSLIYWYKGEAKEYPYRCDGSTPDDCPPMDDSGPANYCRCHQAVAAFERDCVLAEDQEKALQLVKEEYQDFREGVTCLPDRVLYKVSVEMERWEIVEQFKTMFGDWEDRSIQGSEKGDYEYRTIARIKKEETINVKRTFVLQDGKTKESTPQSELDKIGLVVPDELRVSPTPVEEKTPDTVKDANEIQKAMYGNPQWDYALRNAGVPPVAKEESDKVAQPTPREENPIIDAMMRAQFGSEQMSKDIEAHMKEYFPKWPSYKDRFNNLEWYHIFLDFYEKLESLGRFVSTPAKEVEATKEDYCVYCGHGFGEATKESQEELWDEVFDGTDIKFESMHRNRYIEDLLAKYTISCRQDSNQK